LRQRSDVESQRAAEAKAARDTALATFNRKRRQLAECLGSGMDLLTPELVAQITEAAAAASSEPWEALRSFRERLRDLRKENPHASEADLKEDVKGAVQAMIAKARGQRRRADTQRVAAESDTPRDVARFLETRRMTCQDVPGPPSGRMLRGAESEVEQLHNYISCIGCNLHEAIRNRDADLIRSYVPQSSALRDRLRARDDQQRGERPGLGSRGGRRHAARGGRVHGYIVARG
jgi:hypothetical protein